MQEEVDKRAEPTDADLVRRVVAGDVDLYGTLVARHQDGIVRQVARRVPPDRVAEVSQEVFVRAYQGLDRYEPTHPFAHWLHRLAARCCCDFWRGEYRERRRRAGAVSAHSTRVAEEVGDGTSRRPGADQEDRDLLTWLLDRLEIDDRLVIMLEYLEGLSVKECAGLLGWSESKVKVRAHRARRRLREICDRHGIG